MDSVISINWAAILAAVLVNMLVGFIWYSKWLFYDIWVKAQGKKNASMRSGPNIYILSILLAFVQALILKHMLTYTAAYYPSMSNIQVGITTALWLWLGFVVATMGLNYLYAGRSRALFAIDSGYFLCVLLINGVLLASWL